MENRLHLLSEPVARAFRIGKGAQTFIQSSMSFITVPFKEKKIMKPPKRSQVI